MAEGYGSSGALLFARTAEGQSLGPPGGSLRLLKPASDAPALYRHSVITAFAGAVGDVVHFR
ncbi:hypothetical protein [Paenarthrobacter histidinolovorans]|uniref:hypothetical protein n=1 Tax=Paenarthrobacter histidinolovorans TaxID=43664 RepID=UPI00384B272C